MDNPLTPEQLEKLNALSSLSPEEQKKQLQAFLKTLNQKQLAFLKEQQGQRACPFCALAEAKESLVYADDLVAAVLDIHPATAGHLLVFPKQHVSALAQLPVATVAHLFTTINILATATSRTLHPEGINLFVADGAAAGQTIDHILVHVIPRYKKDGLQFAWEGKEVPKEKLADLRQQLQAYLPTIQPSAQGETPISDDSSDEDTEPVPYF